MRAFCGGAFSPYSPECVCGGHSDISSSVFQSSSKRRCCARIPYSPQCPCRQYGGPAIAIPQRGNKRPYGTLVPRVRQRDLRQSAHGPDADRPTGVLHASLQHRNNGLDRPRISNLHQCMCRPPSHVETAVIQSTNERRHCRLTYFHQRTCRARRGRCRGPLS